MENSNLNISAKMNSKKYKRQEKINNYLKLKSREELKMQSNIENQKFINTTQVKKAKQTISILEKDLLKEKNDIQEDQNFNKSIKNIKKQRRKEKLKAFLESNTLQIDCNFNHPHIEEFETPSKIIAAAISSSCQITDLTPTKDPENIIIKTPPRNTKITVTISHSSASSIKSNYSDDIFKHIGKIPPNFVPLYDNFDYEEYKSDYLCKVCNNGNHWFQDCPLNQIEKSCLETFDFKDRDDILRFPVVQAKNNYEIQSYKSEKVFVSASHSKNSNGSLLQDISPEKNNFPKILDFVNSDKDSREIENKFNKEILGCPRCTENHKLSECQEVPKKLPNYIILIHEEEYERIYKSNYKDFLDSNYI